MNKVTKVRLFDAAQLPDELGQVRAEIKELQDIAKGIEVVIKAQGDGTYDSDIFRATVTTGEVKSINWQAIAKSFEPSVQRIVGNTTWKTRTSLRLTAHKKS
ncbi:MAG: hypothetical protein DRQ48_01905 [Gammaproteobacteria bacterium]|nr:MAG: hypothetical protein DRQ48_01905 [Gammaproteobacteria bacterium]